MLGTVDWYLTYIISLGLPNSLTGGIITSFFQRRIPRLRLNCLPQAAQLVDGRAGVPTRCLWLLCTVLSVRCCAGTVALPVEH